MKTLLLILISNLIPAYLWAQELVGSASGMVKNGALQFEWSVGEVFTETMAGDKIITTGFNQPVFKVEDIVINVKEVDIQVFPNPVSTFLLIKTANSISEIELFDAQGELLEISDTYQINMQPYPQGVYILNVLFNSQQSNKYKIIKN